MPAHAIVVLTFSNKAAAELRERVGPRAPGVLCTTFHSFCTWLLRRGGELVGVPRDLKVADARTQSAVLREILRENDLGAAALPRVTDGGAGEARPGENGAESADEHDGERPAAGSGADAVQSALEAVLRFKREAAAAAAAAAAASAGGGDAPPMRTHVAGDGGDERLQLLVEQYSAALRRRKCVDFDDLLLKGAELLRHPEGGTPRLLAPGPAPAPSLRRSPHRSPRGSLRLPLLRHPQGGARADVA